MPRAKKAADMARETDAAAQADALLTAFAADRPGLAVLVARGGEILYERYLGGADLEHGAPVKAATRFHVASVSKQFTAFAAMQLAHAGKIDLAADIRAWLPEMPDFGEAITVSDLIHHTSGLRDQWELMIVSGTPIEGLIRQKAIVAMATRQTALNFSPGTDFCYCNTGYSLLAEIVANASGEKFYRYMQEAVFAPLGMNDTVVYGNANLLLKDRAASYGLTAEGDVRLVRLNYSNYGATSMQSTPRDLLKWSQEMLHPAVFDPALMASLETPGRLRDGAALTYAAGLLVAPFAGRRAIWHSGGDAGYRSILVSFRTTMRPSSCCRTVKPTRARSATIWPKSSWANVSRLRRSWRRTRRRWPSWPATMSATGDPDSTSSSRTASSSAWRAARASKRASSRTGASTSAHRRTRSHRAPTVR
jgi:CubicO group peptidase (beta-lactamase class C family)